MMNVVESYDFDTLEELLEFCKDRESDKEERYYWGFLECFNGELYTIADLKDCACEDWFSDEGVDGESKGEPKGTVYVFGDEGR